MEFETAKIFLGIGLILQLLGVVAAIFGGGILGIVGLIVALVGLYGLANYYGRNDIFTNMLYALVVGIIGIVVSIIVSFGVAVALGWSWAIYQSPLSAYFWGLIIPFLITWVITWAFVVASAFFQRRAFVALYEVSAVKNFDSAAKFVWWGGLTFGVFIGVVLYIIALIQAAVGAFELKPRKEVQAAGTT